MKMECEFCGKLGEKLTKTSDEKHMLCNGEGGCLEGYEPPRMYYQGIDALAKAWYMHINHGLNLSLRLI